MSKGDVEILTFLLRYREITNERDCELDYDRLISIYFERDSERERERGGLRGIK